MPQVAGVGAKNKELYKKHGKGNIQGGRKNDVADVFFTDMPTMKRVLVNNFKTYVL